MNNQVSKLLDVWFPKPNHSNFNLGRKNTFSADVGYIYPVYVEEILPSSYKRLDVEALVQCNATVAPVMGSFTIKLEAFFVPLRIYHRHLLNNDRSADYQDDFDFHYFPWICHNDSYRAYSTTIQASSSPISCQATSLLEYLGMFPSGWKSNSWTRSSASHRINAYPFIGYFDIFRNYYSNPYDTRVPFRVNNEAFSYVDYENQASSDGFVDLRHFDRFVNSVREGSLTTSGAPSPVDVFGNFVKHMCFAYSDPSAQGSGTNCVPLFSGQRLTASTEHTPPTGNAMHYGLLRRTYKDDYFNARISTYFVQYLKEQSKVLVQNESFDITQLRLANRIAKYVDKLGFSDSRFGSWLKAHFGTRLNDRLDIPQFLGSMSSTLAFEDIISRAQTGDSDVITSNQALGSRAGLGSGYMKNKGSFVEFKASEPGYLMVMFSIVPNVSYCQGIKKMYLKTRFMDTYKPEFDAVGYQDLHKVELAALGWMGNVEGNTNLDEYDTVVGKHPSWLEYMTSIDESHGLMTIYGQYGYWTLNRPFDVNAYYRNGSVHTYGGTPPALDFSTYIFPEYFNNIFAVNRLTDNFQVQMRFYDRTSQPMSKQVLPRL